MKRIYKKIFLLLVVCLSVSLCISPFTAFSAEPENRNDEIWETVTYNYVTKSEKTESNSKNALKANVQSSMQTMGLDEEFISEAYTPDALEGTDAITPFDVHGNDDRIKVNPNNSPYCRILALLMGQDTNGDGKSDQWFVGTGFLEGPDVMATAGHNFWNSINGWIEECRIYVRQNSATYGNSFYYPYEWTCATNYTEDDDSNYDWCVVTLQNNLGSANGWFGKAWSKSNINGKNVTVSGYPGGSKQGYQYKDSGTTKISTTYQVYYDVDTEGGQSGSPVYDSNGIVWATHTYGSDQYNCGNRITEFLYTILQEKYLEGVEKWGL